MCTCRQSPCSLNVVKAPGRLDVFAFIKVSNVCRSVCQPTLPGISAASSDGFKCTRNNDPSPYGCLPFLCGLAKTQSVGCEYAHRSFQCNRTSASSASRGIGFREASVLQRVIFCLTTERVTFTSKASKSTSSHLRPSNSPTRGVEACSALRRRSQVESRTERRLHRTPESS